jgi:DNA-directed RNA polymerase specialized sigma24 family protein
MLDSKLHTEEFGGTVDNRLTVQWLLGKLDPEEAEILVLYEIEGLTYAEIGLVIGAKYRGKELTGSAIRYHMEKIIEKLQPYRAAVGE